MTNHPIDQIIWDSLTSFFQDLSTEDWSGRRERECISLYAFSHLIKFVQPNSVLHDLSQVGIEVAVPQITKDISGKVKSKGQVCKDLVIWPNARMTCWDKNERPTEYPLAILEWKFQTLRHLKITTQRIRQFHLLRSFAFRFKQLWIGNKNANPSCA